MTASRWRANGRAACAHLLGLCAVLLAASGWVEAESFVPSDDRYAQIQGAFLQEDFERVVALAAAWFAHPAADPLPATASPDQIDKTTRVWLWYALSLERAQRTSEALQQLDRLKASLSRLPADIAAQAGVAGVWPEVLFWEGEISRKAFQMVRARLAYERALTEFPESSWQPEAQLGLGLVLFHQQSYDAARLQFEAVMLAAPESQAAQEARLLLGLCDLQVKRFENASATFRQLLDRSENRTLRAQVWFYLGEAFTGLRQFPDALQAYTQAIEADRESVWAHLAQFGLGWSYFQQNRCRESLQAFDQYLSDRPQATQDPARAQSGEPQAELLFAQGRCLMDSGEEAQALARLEQFRRRFSEHPLAVEVALNRAQLLERQHRFGEAMAAVEGLLRRPDLEPAQRTQAHLRLGSLQLAQGDAANASAQFQVAQSAEDSELRQAALNGQGDVELFLGNTDAARAWYEEAARLVPLSQGALYATYQLGRLKLHEGSVGEAIALFQQLVERAEGVLALDARLALALAHLANSQPQPARMQLERLRVEEPTSPHATRAGYYLALLALHEGDMAEAKRLCQELIQRVPDSEEALDARLLLTDIVASQSSPQQAIAMLSEAFGSLEGLAGPHRGRLAKKLGDLARQAGTYPQAIQWYETAWQELPVQRGELDYRLASCYEEAGDYATAARRYRSITQAPWQIRGQLAAAKLMEREDRWQEARVIYERIARQAVPEAKIAQERLATLKTARP